MGLQYSCFVSYPHGQDNVLVPFVTALVKALETEIGAQTRLKVWFDPKLRGGMLLDPTIAQALCRSACMLLVYTPLYFDPDHTYCAQELKAMHDLETRRLNAIKDTSNGLIIPIILRGKKRFPQALSSKYKYYSLDDLALNLEETLRIHFANQIKEIAEYIVERCDALVPVADSLHHDCAAYCLPSENDARKFMTEQLRLGGGVAVPFVSRTEATASAGAGP